MCSSGAPVKNAGKVWTEIVSSSDQWYGTFPCIYWRSVREFGDEMFCQDEYCW